MSSSADNRLFIFLRWSPHFLSIYTRQFRIDTNSLINSMSFAILHLLPVDIRLASTLNDMIIYYEQNLLASTTNGTVIDDVKSTDYLIFLGYIHTS
jgi:hypothetical protein